MISIRFQPVLKGAKLGLSHKLYMRNGQLKSWYERVIEDKERNFDIAIAFDGELPIGIIMIEDREDVNIYIKYAYRRQGVASRLLRHMALHRQIYRRNLKAGYGVDGSQKFWKNQDVYPFNDKEEKRQTTNPAYWTDRPKPAPFNPNGSWTFPTLAQMAAKGMESLFNSLLVPPAAAVVVNKEEPVVLIEDPHHYLIGDRDGPSYSSIMN